MARKKNLKRKLEIVFDAQKRREFLTGFSKRKNARRKCAKEELEKRIKEERKRIRQEIKNGVQHLKKSFEPLRELTDEDKIPMEENVTNEEEYEDDDVKIKIVELTTKEMAKRTHCLGENYPSDNDNDDGNDVNNEYNSTKKSLEKKSIKDLNSIPGMDYDNEQKIKLANDEPKNSIVMNHTSTKNSNAKLMININRSEIKSKKDLNHLMKMNTMKQMRKSKVFQMKKRLEQNANQKRARRKQRNTMKSLPKHLRNLKKLPINRYHKERLKTKNRKKRK